MTVKELMYELMEHDMEREVYIEVDSSEDRLSEYNFSLETNGTYYLELQLETKDKVIVDKEEYDELVAFKDDNEE